MKFRAYLRAGAMFCLTLPMAAQAQEQSADSAVPAVRAVTATAPTRQGGANIAVIAGGGADLRVIGTAELSGLELYGAGGDRLAAVPAGEAAGVDMREGFPVAGQQKTLVVAAETTDNTLQFYTLDNGSLNAAGARSVPLDFAVESVCLWHSASDGNFYAFAVGGGGNIDQQLVFADANGKIDSRQARHLNVASEVKHCVADDRTGDLYVSEEAVGIWRFGADPEAEIVPHLVDATRLGHITEEVSGLALYDRGPAHWLLASDASANQLFVYDRGDGGSWKGAVAVQSADGVPVSEPGGLFATSDGPAGRFAQGMLTVADEDAPGGSVYQLFAMGDVAAALGVATPADAAPQNRAGPRFPVVTARAETTPVDSPGDAADDPAIWANPDAPEQSLIVATDKKAGLYLYDMKGQVVDFAPVGKMNNVDLRSGFMLDGKPVVIVAATDRTRKAIALFRLDTQARKLVDIADGVQQSGLSDPYGLCMYKSGKTGSFYVFANDPDGLNRQWEVVAGPNGKATLRAVRDIKIATQTEGCVADDANARLYVGEEDVGLWRFGAEPDAGTEGVLVDTVADNPAVKDDVEGVSLYDLGGGRGYIVASSQGNNSYAVYDRQGDNRYLGSFSVVADGAKGIDGISETDGLDINSMNLGPDYPAGAMVAQDGRNVLPGDRQNFKIVDWRDIAAALELDQK